MVVRSRRRRRLPVSMLSLTMHVPEMSTASQYMVQPVGGMMTTSPGTRSSVATVSMLPSLRNTSIMSLPCTVLRNFRWFCTIGKIKQMKSKEKKEKDGGQEL